MEPDNTAVKTALWRALHLLVDEKPHIFEDEIGLKLIDPPDGWQQRPNMNFTKRLRAAIVARARFIEDLIIQQSQSGITQYVILGAGLDTFAQRRPDIAADLQVYEIDQPNTLAWKKHRLMELGYGIPDYLHFVPASFETASWWEQLLKAGFNIYKPAFVACSGVSLYLTQDAITATLHQLATLISGSKLAITFYLPFEMLEAEDKFIHELGQKSAQEAGTPFVSYFTPNEILALAKNSGFKVVETISTKEMVQLYFTDRTDNLIPASGEVFLVATT